MKDIQLLDCTLRDGGYVNDWEFGHSNLIGILERSADAGVDIIEIGFLDDRRPFDSNRSIMPDTQSAYDIWHSCRKRPPMIVGMIDYGTCAIENLQPCKDSILDGIRVIFKEQKMQEAMTFCAKVKELGYKVFSQLVSITTYTDEALLDLIRLVNEVEPYAVSMVDTYGLLYPQDMLHYYQILDEQVKDTIKIGFHAHNNLQLAYANSLAFIEYQGKHDIIVDGTLFGMGKSAGNAPIELLAFRLNACYGKHYLVDSMLEGIEESVRGFYDQSPWGYQIMYYLSSYNKCHPNYVTFFIAKQNLTITGINALLSMIPKEDRLLYQKKVAEDVYCRYLEEMRDADSRRQLYEALKEKTILLVGPGKNIKLQQAKVKTFLEKEKPVMIAVNFIPEDFPVDYLFVTKQQRYHKLQLDQQKVIATSNVAARCKCFDYVIEREPLLEKQERIIDNSFLMLLRLLYEIGIHSVHCAGFDGYSEKEDNYFISSMEYGFVKQEARRLNSHVREVVAKYRGEMDIQFITYSAYNMEEDVNSAAF